MDEVTIRNVLRSDARVKDLISARAYQYYLSRRATQDGAEHDEQNGAEHDWHCAEKEVIDDLVEKLIEAQAESWRAIEDRQPGFQPAHNFATLIGFMLASGGLPARGDLYNPRYYTIGLSYITGMFKIGRTLDEGQFLQLFSNDNAVVKALLYRMRTNPDSPYYSRAVGSEGELKVHFDNDEDLSKYLAYAESQARLLFDLFKKLLLGQSVAAAV
jgi:hypothetical protein